MTRTASPSAPNVSAGSGTASPTADASGYLLLTIQNAVVNQVYAGEEAVLARGELRLECISLPIPPEIGHQTANPFSPSPSDPAVPTHDFWLVLRIGPTFEMPLIPTQKAESSRSTSGVAYTIDSQAIPDAKLSLVLPLPASSADLEDLDSFEVLLRQYGSLPGESTALKDLAAPHLAGGPSSGVGGNVPGGAGGAGGAGGDDMRGKLVLVNEDSGEVVGELDHGLDLEEDHSVAKDDKDKPVVLDFGNVIDGYMPVVKVRTVPEDEMDDWILKGAHYLSMGILSAGSWSSKTIQSSADMIIRNTKQYDKPVHLPSAAKAGVRMTHNASARTVKVTKRTMGMVNDAVQNVVEQTYKKGVEPAVDLYKAANEGRRQSIEALFGYEEKPALASPQPQTSEKAQLASGPPLPLRKPSPLQSEAIGRKIDVPSKTDTLLAQEQARDEAQTEAEADTPPAYSDKPVSQSVPIAPKPAMGGIAPDRQAASTPPKKRPFLNRLLLAGEVVLTSLEATAQDLINSGTGAASSVAGHKLGPEAERATALLGGSVRNVAVVYIDVRGVGRRALLKGTAKGFVKARLASGEEVKLQGEGEKVGGIEVEEGQVERTGEGIVVGMTEVQKVEQPEVPEPTQPTQSASTVEPDEKAALAEV